MRKTIQPVQF